MSVLASSGGALVLASSAALAIVGILAALGAPVGMGVVGAGGVGLVVALVLGCLGAAAIALSGPPPLDGRGVRAGLITLAIGLGTSASAAMAATIEFDPLESLPVVVLTLVGGLALLAGGPLVLAFLLRAGGRSRGVGLTFLAGLAIAVGAGSVLNEVLGATSGAGPVGVLVTLVTVGGLVAMLAAWAGVGVLALDRSRIQAGGAA